jgi:hypothetical protein
MCLLGRVVGHRISSARCPERIYICMVESLRPAGDSVGTSRRSNNQALERALLRHVWRLSAYHSRIQFQRPCIALPLLSNLCCNADSPYEKLCKWRYGTPLSGIRFLENAFFLPKPPRHGRGYCCESDLLPPSDMSLNLASLAWRKICAVHWH